MRKHGGSRKLSYIIPNRANCKNKNLFRSAMKK